MKKNFTCMLALCAFIIFGSQKAMAGTETYAFQEFAQTLTANTAKFTGSSTVTINNTVCDVFNDIDGFSFNGRFAGQGSNGSNGWIFQRNNGLYSFNGGPRILAILNLKAGDKVTINYSTETSVTFTGTISVADVSSGDVVTSGTTYEMASDGYLAMNVERYTCFTSVVIETAAAETVTTPKIAVTGANGIERTVTITPGKSNVEDAECTTIYTVDGSDPYESMTSEASSGNDPIVFTVDESCTVKAITIGTTGALSEVASLDVTAGDYIELNLALSVAMNDGVATFTATSDNSNIYGAPTATISFAFDGQEAGDGNSFTPTADGALLVTASADGYGDKEIEVPVFAKYKERWASSDYSTPGIGGDFEGWVLSSETGRWANWADVEGGYTYYVLEESTANNITLEGDEDGKEGVRMRGVLAFVDGFGISRNVTGTETIGNIASKGLGRIATFRIYNGYNKSESYYEVGYVNLDGSSWLQHQLQGGHCLVQTIAYMGDEQPAPSVATAIQTVNVEKEDNAVFNLQGQRVSNPAHGIFITKGRKVVF